MAEVLVNYSTGVKAGDRVLIEVIDCPVEAPLAIAEAVFSAGGIPIVEIKDNRIQRALYWKGCEAFFKTAGDIELNRMKRMDCYITVRGNRNQSELSDVPSERMRLYERHWFKPVHLDERCFNTRWVVTGFPSGAEAQRAGMSLEGYEDFFFAACCETDWHKLSGAMEKHKTLMDRTDIVKITGPGTELEFSIKGIDAVKCDGRYNIPDGEVYTSPVLDSVNGTIRYNVPSTYRGFTFSGVEFTIKNGRIIEAKANDTKRLNEILDADEGARYFGEFAIGVNPYIQKPMDFILFDEKIIGSLHFTPGDSFPPEEQGGNGNRSAIHWDLVLIQTEEYGGGELYFDDTLVRKDGIFVLDELKGLNRENLTI